MESSQVLGVTEECGSSESGWTMYIATPTHKDNYDDDDDDDDHDQGTSKGGGDHDNNDEDGGDEEEEEQEEEEEDSDDSMASVASSGPSHPELPCGSHEGNRGMGLFKHAENEDHSKRSSGKKPNKHPGKKRDEKRIKAEKVETVPEANSATQPRSKWS